MRLLLIEDEIEIASALASALGRFGAVVNNAPNCAEGLEASKSGEYDCIILDRQLPDGDGLDLLKELRRVAPGAPIIVLTARGNTPDRVSGLNQGADDYVSKPFDLDELVARIRAVMRRPGAVREETVSMGRLEFDLANMQASVAGAPIRLRRREMMVLATLMRRGGKTVLRSVMEEAVFGFDDEVSSNTLDAHISRLRRKLEEADSNLEIIGIRGVGYLLGERPA